MRRLLRVKVFSEGSLADWGGGVKAGGLSEGKSLSKGWILPEGSYDCGGAKLIGIESFENGVVV